MRRTFIGWLRRNKQNRCYWCGKALTEDEIIYYGNSCNKCEEKITYEYY